MYDEKKIISSDNITWHKCIGRRTTPSNFSFSPCIH